MAIKEFVDDVYEVIQKHKDQSGMTPAEACGFLKIISDEISENCRKDLGRGQEGEEPPEPWRGPGG